jgi:hypothetical protein
MKKIILVVILMISAILLTSCVWITDIIQNAEQLIPSNKIIDETRAVSSFAKIELRTIGTIILTQGDSELLRITGPDNVVPKIRSVVRNNTLVLEMQPGVRLLNFSKNTITFRITVKDLTNLSVSGLGDVEMAQLATSSLEVFLSGKGQIKFDKVTAEQVKITITGLGDAIIAGTANQLTVSITGSGSVQAGELSCKMADVAISGLGQATLWVTDQLKGTISGSGTVSYYGNPQLDTQISGLGSFKSLGSKG